MIQSITNARLNVTLPDGFPIVDVSTANPDADLEVVAGLSEDATGVVLLRVVGEDVCTMLADIADHSGIFDLAIARSSDRKATVQCAVSEFELLTAAKRGGIPIEMPVEISGATAAVQVTGPHDRLSAFAENLVERGMEYEIEYVQRRQEPSELLTDTQRELLLAAVDIGYYDTPRGCTQEELAAELGVAKSTCSGVLHRAEEAIVKNFVDSLPAQAADSPKRISH